MFSNTPDLRVAGKRMLTSDYTQVYVSIRTYRFLKFTIVINIFGD